MYKKKMGALIGLFLVAWVVTPSVANAYFELSQIRKMFDVLRLNIAGNNLISLPAAEGKSGGENTSPEEPSEELALEDAPKTMTLVLTAYSSSPDETDEDPFITAAGTIVREGIVATNFLPFGTKIKIPEHFGDKMFVVKDRMNRRFQNRVDIWFSSKIEAQNFGKKISYIVIMDS